MLVSEPMDIALAAAELDGKDLPVTVCSDAPKAQPVIDAFRAAANGK